MTYRDVAMVSRSMRGSIITFLVLGVALMMPRVSTGAPFTSLAEGFSQELFATANAGSLFGGVAFAPNGDMWVSDCPGGQCRLHRFDSQMTISIHDSLVHPQIDLVQTVAGLGLANHPNGFLYSNAFSGGIVALNAETGLFVGSVGPPGNALGIAVDPLTQNLIYASQDCENRSPCDIQELDPLGQSLGSFARLYAPFVPAHFDGISIDPSGEFAFLADFSAGGILVASRGDHADGLGVMTIPVPGGADGVSFHRDPPFVLTNNNNGTMSRINFAGPGFSPPVVVEQFASGGFRGDLTTVGRDGCVYATQQGMRFEDGSTSGDNSVVRICPGFVPPPGVTPCTSTFVGPANRLVLHCDAQSSIGSLFRLGITHTAKATIGVAIVPYQTIGSRVHVGSIPRPMTPEDFEVAAFLHRPMVLGYDLALHFTLEEVPVLIGLRDALDFSVLLNASNAEFKEIANDRRRIDGLKLSRVLDASDRVDYRRQLRSAQVIAREANAGKGTWRRQNFTASVIVNHVDDPLFSDLGVEFADLPQVGPAGDQGIDLNVCGRQPPVVSFRISGGKTCRVEMRIPRDCECLPDAARQR